MAKINPDLAGAYQRSVGNVVYYVKNGINYARSKSKSPYTSQSPAQMVQRGKFGSITQLASVMQGVIDLGFPQRKKGWSPANAFCNLNKSSYAEAADGQITIDFELLQCSKGALFIPDVAATLDKENRKIEITAEAMPDETNCNGDDEVYAALLDTGNKFCRLVKVCKREEGGTQSIILAKYWNPDSVVAYAFAVSANGKKASNTLFLNLE